MPNPSASGTDGLPRTATWYPRGGSVLRNEPVIPESESNGYGDLIRHLLPASEEDHQKGAESGPREINQKADKITLIA